MSGNPTTKEVAFGSSVGRAPDENRFAVCCTFSRLTVSPAPDRYYLAGLELDSVHGMRFHKLPLQVSNALGPLIIKFEISDGPASACIHGRWFHQCQLPFVDSHQLIPNLSPVCGQHGALYSRERSAEIEHFFTQIPADAVGVFQVN